MLRVTSGWCLVEQKASSEGFAAVGGAGDESGEDPFDCLVVLRQYKEKREFGKSGINKT